MNRILSGTEQPNELIVSEESVADGTVIWRYFKFERFMDILKNHSLWFSRPFRFEDEWEGLFPPSYVRRTRQYADANGIPFKEFDRDFRRRLLQHRCEPIGRAVNFRRRCRSSLSRSKSGDLAKIFLCGLTRQQHVHPARQNPISFTRGRIVRRRCPRPRLVSPSQRNTRPNRGFETA